MTEEAYPDALAVGHRLHWYVLEHVLGQGGFGITYVARDTNLDRRVAIKEYLPTDIARRRSDASACAHTEAHAERFAWGLERFLSEARTLARFDHPNIVRVYSVFEANNTAYMVMRFEEGENLAELLKRKVTLSERELMGCLLPILEGLQLVHSGGYIHRDIKPENIYVRHDGSPVLLDFGSARQSFGSSKTLTVLVAPGYAPLEQYYGDAETQGPWTDIYGLGATCYRIISGQAPIDAVVRAKGVLGSAREILKPAVEAGRGRYSERFLAAVDHALQLSEHDRPQSIADWRLEIAGPSAPTVARAAVPEAPTPGAPAVHSAASEPSPPIAVPMSRSPLVRNLALAGALGVGLLFVITTLRNTPEPTPPPKPALAFVPESSPVTPPAPARVQEASPQATVTVADVALNAPKPVAIAPRVAYVPTEREARTAPQTRDRPANPTAARGSAEPGPLLATVPSPSAVLSPAPAPVPVATSPVPVPVPAPVGTNDTPGSHKLRDDQLEAADLALRRGDTTAATELLAPWAAAGVPRAQVMLGRAHEGRGGRQQSDFEAYVWYSMAARSGEPGAQALREKVAVKLQPAEIRQADHLIESWKPRAEPTASVTR